MCIGVKVDDAALLTSSHSLRQLTTARHSSPQLAATGHSSPQLATARHSLPQLATACQSLPRLTTAYHSSPQLAATGHSWPQLATAHTTALLQRCAPSHRAQQPARLTCTQAAAWAEGLEGAACAVSSWAGPRSWAYLRPRAASPPAETSWCPSLTCACGQRPYYGA